MTDRELLEQYRLRLRQATGKLDELQAALKDARSGQQEPIAIIGMACRFPAGASSPEEYFARLLAGVDGIVEVPAERTSLRSLRQSGQDPSELPGVRWGGFLAEVEGFDAAFFGIAPREAQALDPQQRLLLELAWEALEDGGIIPSQLSGRQVGVFIGMTAQDYAELCLAADPEGRNVYMATGNGHSFAAGRISYSFGLKGPSMTVDTACSSSLVALHLACQSLRAGECELALIGGVNLILSPTGSKVLARSQALSPDGHCRTFDAQANGFVRGEGGAVVVLQRLSDARLRGNPVAALLRGSAVNQDGRSSGLTAPSGLAQKELLEQALRSAGIRADEVAYIETHGTGTGLGDPIELEALKAVFGGRRQNDCVLGAVKTQIGHLEAAAGMAGLLKVVLSLQNERIPANLHYEVPTPRVDLAGSGLSVTGEIVPFPRGARPRLCGVSGFGLSGTNAHLLVEEAAAEAPPPPPAAPGLYLLPLSARSPAALAAQAESYRRFLSAWPGSLYDVVWTAALRRSAHAERLVAMGASAAELQAALTAYTCGEPSARYVAGRAEVADERGVVLVFPGQGTQRAGMGTRLRAASAAFAQTFAECERLVRVELGWSLSDELSENNPSSRLAETEVAQVGLFAVQAGLVSMYRERGVKIGAVIGHSVGEVTAAYAAEALSLAQAIRVVCQRARAMQGPLGAGAMLAVEMDEAKLTALLDALPPGVEVAAMNDPRTVVLAGAEDDISAAAATLQQGGGRCKRLEVGYAFHSRRMETAAQQVEGALTGIAGQLEKLPIYSTVTGEQLRGTAITPAYWKRNVREPVRFFAAVNSALRDGFRLLLEVGPRAALWAHIERAAKDSDDIRVIPATRRGEDEEQAFFRALLSLWTAGGVLSWESIYPTRGQLVKLPAYPWQRQRYFIEGAAATGGVEQATALPAAERAAAEVALPEEAGSFFDRAALAETVHREITHVLGLPTDQALPPRRGFFELGMDSLMSVELRKRLERRLERALSPTVLFDHSTLESLIEHLSDDSPAAAALRFKQHAEDEPIAIIGMACRFPGGANSPAAYWQLLRAGTDAVCEVPSGRWERDAFYDPDPDAPGKMYVCKSGFLRDVAVDEFDAEFFNISPREAQGLDPQQRLLLELSWEALEDAGQPADRLVGSRTGVFVGIATSDYAQIANQIGLAQLDPYVGTGNSVNTAAGRLSYFLGLRGPSLALDTACSSSLVALHLGCQSLLAGESELALVGGVNLILAPVISVLYSRMRALAPDGRCKAFDDAADGMVRGEGGAMVVLKPYRAARRDGDRVLALIRGSAVNHDGRSSGLTVPSGTAQREVLRTALRAAQVSPTEVLFIEAHGTGTSLGDPIEANALLAEFGRDRLPTEPLYLGSVKANLGHLEAAAGLAGLLKVVLMLEQGEIPPQINFDRLNSQIAESSFPLMVPRQLVPWPHPERPRLAGVSSFGVSGTNAHVIVAAPPPVVAEASPAPTPDDEPLLLVLSARQPTALSALAAAYRQRLCDDPATAAALCHTAATRRAHLEQRLACFAESPAELVAVLDAYLQGTLHPRFVKSSSFDAAGQKASTRLAAVFSGHSGHWVGMGRQLLSREPVFRAAFLASEQAMRNTLEGTLSEHLLASDAAVRWERPDILQPLLFALQVGLFAWLRALGLRPAAVIGHSVGEIAAAHCAGALTLLDAAELVCRRSALLARLHGQGAMAVVALTREQTEASLRGYEDRIAIAACNSPLSTVISGEPAALEELLTQLGRRNVFVRKVAGASAAGHSPQVEPLLDELRRALSGLKPRATTTPFYSTVTATAIDGTELAADYFARNLRQPVLFTQTVAQLGREGFDGFIEIGPQPLLLSAIEQTLRPQGGALLVVPTLKANEPEQLSLLRTVARLHVARVPLDLAALRVANAAGQAAVRPFHPAPTYPFVRQRYWGPVAAYSSSPAATVATPSSPKQPALAAASRFGQWLYQLAWRELPLPPASEQAPSEEPWLIFADAAGLGDRVASQLRERGVRVRVVRRGPTLQLPEDAPWQVDPGQREQFVEVVAAARLHGPRARVLYLFGLDAASSDREADDALSDAEGALSVGLLHLLFALGDAGHGKLYLATRGAQAVLPDEPVQTLHQATLWGLGKAIAAEQPHLFGRLIDLDGRATEKDVQLLIDELLSEDGEEYVAWRDGVRRAARLVRRADLVLPEPGLTVHADGTYLITGGLGGTGLALARWLVRHGARHLFLVSRRGLPPRSEWPRLSPSSEDGQRAAAIGRLEQAAAQVHVVAADIAERGSVIELMRQIDGSGQRLRGVLHAAGVADPKLLSTTTAESLRVIYRPKIKGALLLHELSRGLELDFFVCFSSAAAVWGGAGLGAYAAANQAMDTLAHHRRTLGLPGLSVNFGGLDGGGMATAEVQRVAAAMGLHMLPLSTMLDALGAFIGAGLTQIIVGHVDWQLFKPLYEARRKRPLFAEIETETDADGAAPSELLQQLSGAPPDERYQRLEAHVRVLAAAVLGLSDPLALDRQQGFFQMGMDSVMSVTLRNQLERSLGCSLPPTLAFENPSVMALTCFLAEKVLHWPISKVAGGPAKRPEAALDGLSEAELEALLLAELNGEPKEAA